MNNKMTPVENAEIEAAVLENHALFLSKAAKSKNVAEKAAALNSNLKLWAEIGTNVKDTNNTLPQHLKNNLLALAKFVEKLTMNKGLNMTKQDFDCLANINMQISEGFKDSVQTSLAQEEAFSLLKCALDLSTARDSKSKAELVTALDNNMKLWVYIKTLAASKSNPLPKDAKKNLVKLADYVSLKTIEVGRQTDNPNKRTIDSMINTNLQISEGLLERNKS